jgi:hypothetical protein
VGKLIAHQHADELAGEPDNPTMQVWVVGENRQATKERNLTADIEGSTLDLRPDDTERNQNDAMRQATSMEESITALQNNKETECVDHYNKVRNSNEKAEERKKDEQGPTHGNVENGVLEFAGQTQSSQ